MWFFSKKKQETSKIEAHLREEYTVLASKYAVLDTRLEQLENKVQSLRGKVYKTSENVDEIPKQSKDLSTGISHMKF